MRYHWQCRYHHVKKINPATPEPEPEKTITSEYMLLKIGNYWIYQRYYLSSISGDIKMDNVFDSIYIDKDTMIHNRKYFKLSRDNNLMSILIPGMISDSSGYLLAAPGNIILNPNLNHRRTAESSTAKITEYTTSKDSLVNTSAGNFTNTINYITFREEKQASFSHGCWHRIYAKNVGLIQREVYFANSNQNVLGVKLVRYKVN